MTTTANLSSLLIGSLLHDNSPPITAIATHVLGQLAVGGCIDSKGHVAALLFMAVAQIVDGAIALYYLWLLQLQYYMRT